MSKREPVAASSLTVSLRDVPRRVGTTRSYELQWHVPAGMGTPMMAIREGALVPVTVDITSIDEGVLVRARCQCDLEGQCVRCLDDIVQEADVDESVVYYDQQPEGDEDALVISAHDMLDLEPMLRDAIVPLIDPQPLCGPDCQGLCPHCGERLDDLPEDHHHEVIDPRMASLAQLLDDLNVQDGQDRG